MAEPSHDRPLAGYGAVVRSEAPTGRVEAPKPGRRGAGRGTSIARFRPHSRDLQVRPAGRARNVGSGNQVRYYRISPKFWSDPMVGRWSDDAKLVALYLLTCEHRVAEGLFRFPKMYGVADLQWLPERFTQAFRELLDSGFIEYDTDAQVVLIRSALKWQSPANENQAKAAAKKLEEVPPTPLAATFLRLAERFSERLVEQLPEGFGEPIPDPPAPSPTPDPDTPSVTTFPQAAPPSGNGSTDRQQRFQALADACGLDVSQLTKNERGKLNAAEKQLREIDVDPADIALAAKVWRNKFPDAELTPQAIANNWAQLQADSDGDWLDTLGPANIV